MSTVPGRSAGPADPDARGGNLPVVAGQGTPATVLLGRQKVAHRVHSYRHDPRSESYGAEAAAALGVEPVRCFKTLVATVDGGLTVAVVPVTGSLDLKALAGAVGGKRAAMADPALAERTTGYVRGGISPLGQRKRLPTVVDASALEHGTVYVSAGRRGLEIELAPADLVRLTDAAVAPIGG
jgi:Cys-tRNA(Pro)/Cys-tRNA(Cys) deacylase